MDATVPHRWLGIWAAALLSLLPSTAGALSVGAPFGHGMVLQRDVPVPIWGTAAPGERVRVVFRGKRAKTVADSDGRWSLTLPAIPPGIGAPMKVRGSRVILIEDVMVGDVWLGAGQENMTAPVHEFVRRDIALASDLANAPHPRVRFYTSGPGAEWQEANAVTIRDFSAMMFAMGLRMQTELDVPIGVMVAAEEGGGINSWLNPDALADEPLVDRVVGRAGARIVIGDLFEERIRPLARLAIRGVLWDGGDKGSGIQNITVPVAMSALIGGWRKAWNREDLPFLYVQKPNGGGCAFDPKARDTAASDDFEDLPKEPPASLAGFTRAQWIAVRNIPGTTMVTSSDLGSGEIPRDKWSYGTRAARVAMRLLHGAEGPIYGPTYRTHEFEGSSVRVVFDNIGGKLVYRGGRSIQGFSVAGDDKVFQWADARVEGNTVVVRSRLVPQPKAVRYGWGARHAWANLFNDQGLPALSFSADSR